MTTYTIRTSQLVPAPIERVWAFFSRPENLGRITPSSMGFVMKAPVTDLGDGSLIDYTIRPLLGIPAGWRSRIEGWNPPFGFRDVQLKGPYKRWVHTHTLTAVDGGTRVDDVVEYQLPLGPLGRLAHGWLVRPELERIFAYRRYAVDAVFEPVTDEARAAAKPGATLAWISWPIRPKASVRSGASKPLHSQATGALPVATVASIWRKPAIGVAMTTTS